MNSIKRHTPLFLLPLFLTTPLATAAPTDCALSQDLVYRANELYNQRAPVPEQVAILTQAVEVCPSNAYAHNNLANHLGDLGRFADAVRHYQQALALKPDLIDAWYGLGEAYQAWGRLPQSLEAFLHACTQDKDARVRVVALLKDNRFAGAEAGEVLDREALAVLFDKARRQEISRMAQACGIGGDRAVVEVQPILRNLEFETGQARFADNPINRRQLEEIGAALNQLAPERRIHIHGHSDDQPFAHVSREESDQRNLQLSQERAETIRSALVAQGVAADRLLANGHGATQAISTNRARNRRVEIAAE